MNIQDFSTNGDAESGSNGNGDGRSGLSTANGHTSPHRMDPEATLSLVHNDLTDASDNRLLGQRTRGYERRQGGDRRRAERLEERFRVAVLLPCRDEATTIGDVVRDFARALPEAKIWVYDNNSTDDTVRLAKEAGAQVHEETKPGKGQVLRRMFSEIDADIYVIADGDGTYDAEAAPRLIDELVTHRLDMVVGRRLELPTAVEAYRPGHRLGNALLTGVVQRVFGQGSLDMLSGYRVLSRRYVKSFPANSRRFETETEMTVHALDLGLPFSEIDTDYRERPPESHSKLRTIPDGLQILKFILMLVKEYRPTAFFGSLGLISGILALVARVGLYGTLTSLLSVGAAKGLVSALLIMMIVLFGAGLILDSVSRGRRDVKRMTYLGLAGPTPFAVIERRRDGTGNVRQRSTDNR
jgi:glycosyltransferase involved in cell wall biosynthesis